MGSVSGVSLLWQLVSWNVLFPLPAHTSLLEMWLQSQSVYVYREGLFDFWVALVWRGFSYFIFYLLFWPNAIHILLPFCSDCSQRARNESVDTLTIHRLGPLLSAGGCPHLSPVGILELNLLAVLAFYPLL